jgi:N-acetylmuramoyl-L-alanine amidase
MTWLESLPRRAWLSFRLFPLVFLAGCQTPTVQRLAFPAAEPRRGDEIVAAGQFFHTGTRVVLWMDPGGYDAYRVERRFAPLEKSGWEASHLEVKDLSSPNHYNLRKGDLTAEEVEKVRGGGWDLPSLQRVVDQFVIHYDACGTSRQCFKVLHDLRGLSVHFLLDVDGTVYQTLDLKERAWHATSSNSRSVGIEIANIGAYAPGNEKPLSEWYESDGKGCVRLKIPQRIGEGGIFTRGFVGHPARCQPVSGLVQGHEYIQYDFTPQQYEALIQLAGALCSIFPNLKCDAPRNAAGEVSSEKLPDAELKTYQGILGHLHIQSEKVDPGPAFQWDHFLRETRKRLNQLKESSGEHDTSLGHMRRIR